MQKKHWYAAQTKYKKEQAFADNIKCKGFTTFFPKKNNDTPLFEQYIFIQASQCQLHKCANTVGLFRMVSFGGYPCVIPDEQIEFLKIIEKEFQETDVTGEILLEGDKILIIEGPLAGYEAILTEDQGKNRVALQVTKLNQSVLIDVPIKHIELLERKPLEA